MNTLGSIIGAAGLVPLLTVADLRLRRLGFAAWLSGAGLLAISLLQSPLTHVRHTLATRPLLGVVALMVGCGGLAAATVATRRWPWLFLCAVVAAAPIRIPFSVGGSTANLLVPLYVVTAAGVVASAYDLFRGVERPPRLGAAGWAMAGFVGWSALSMAWSADDHRGAVTMLFFYLPFGILLARLGALDLRPPLLCRAFAVQLCLGVLFAAIALWQEVTHHIFWNPKVEVGNQYKSFFRVNSVFWDPSIYGRFMAVTLIILAGLAIHRRAANWVPAVMVAVFGGLYFAYSQSSLLALAVGVLALGAGLWPRRATIALIAAGAIGGAGALALALQGNSANRVTSDRLHLVRLADRVIAHHPVIGAGLGGFARAALAGTEHPWRVGTAASHTTVLTVLAEQGPLGLALYLALIASVAVAALRGDGPRGVRLTLLAAFIAILASSLFYNAFFEDPATWILIALIALISRTSTPAPAREHSV